MASFHDSYYSPAEAGPAPTARKRRRPTTSAARPRAIANTLSGDLTRTISSNHQRCCMSRQRAGPALTQGVTSSLLDPKRAPPRRRCRSRQTCRHSERQKARSSARVVPALDRAVRRLNAGTTACGGLMLPKCALTLAILGVAILGLAAPVVSALVGVLVVAVLA